MFKVNIKSEIEVNTCNLPQEYLEFNRYFEFGKNCFKISHIINEKNGLILPFENVIFRTDGSVVTIECLFSVSDINAMYVTGDSFYNEYADDSMIRIGMALSPLSSSLFVGVGEDNYGKVFIGTYVKPEEKYTLLAQSIVDLVGNLEKVYNPLQMDKEKTELLFRNWNEEFWRVKKSVDQQESI